MHIHCLQTFKCFSHKSTYRLCSISYRLCRRFPEIERAYSPGFKYHLIMCVCVCVCVCARVRVCVCVRVCACAAHARVKSLQLCLTLSTLWTIAIRLLCPWVSLGKNTGGGCNFLLQGIFLMKGSKPHLLTSNAMAGEFFTTSKEPGKPHLIIFLHLIRLIHIVFFKCELPSVFRS